MSKRLFLILSMLFFMSSVSFAQMRSPFDINTDGFFDFELKYGGLNDQINRASMSLPYSNPINVNQGKLSITGSSSLGFAAKIGYFFNDKKTWGITVGLSYLYQYAKLSLDSFHVEYRNLDSQKRIFRQIISSQNIGESISGNNVCVPFMLHYQRKYSRLAFFSVDAGILYNLSMANNYTASANFTYEALYKYDLATKSFVYDNNPVINPKDPGYIPMTISQYYATNPKGTNLSGYFDQLSQKWGANLGINKPVTSNSGVVKYKHGSIGYIFEPSVNYQLSDLVFIKLGFYYINQTFEEAGNGSTKQLTSKIGDFSGLTNSITTINTSSMGINIGIKYLIKDKIEESILYIAPF